MMLLYHVANNKKPCDKKISNFQDGRRFFKMMTISHKMMAITDLETTDTKRWQFIDDGHKIIPI